MKRRRVIGLLLFLHFADPIPIAKAGFHPFEIREVYSNYDGTVQFIELYTAQEGQGSLIGKSVSATSTVNSVSSTNTYAFVANVGSSMAQSRVLLATSSVVSLTWPSIAVTPNYTIPAHFFNPFASEIVFSYDLGAIHLDTLTVSAPWYVPRNGFQ